MRTSVAAAGVALFLAAASGGCGPPTAPSPALHLTDVTEDSGLAFETTSGRTPATQILEVKGGGLGLADLDGDGLLDVFVPNGATLERPDHGPGARLFLNAGHLRFRDATADWGLDFHRWGFGCAAGDVEGDGDEDLFVACFGRDELLLNAGGRLVPRGAEAGVAGPEDWSTACAFGDVDLDGDLDLYVANFVRFDPARPPPPMTFLGVEVFAGPMGLPAAPDRLYENRGDGTFRDVSLRSGIRGVEARYGLGVAVLDFDLDGRPEIFVGNDSGPNFLFWRADEGPFQDRGVQSGIATNQDGGEQATMGIAVGDVNGDALPDVFTTNFMNDTNTLHVNLGGLRFEDQTRRFGLASDSRPFLGWATAFVDFDRDGDEDLVVFNGHVYPEEITRPHRWGHAQTPLLYARDGDRFRRVRPDEAGAWLAEAHCDRSAVFGDLDRDGDVDVVVCESNGPVRVLRNDAANGTYLVVRLEDPASKNRRALGARVRLEAEGLRLTRWVGAPAGYQSSPPPEAFFGLPEGVARVRLLVDWPGGGEETFDDVPVGGGVVLRRGR